MRSEQASTEAPTLVVVTSGGELPGDHPALPGAVVITTAPGARRLRERAIRCRDVIEVGDADDVPASAIVEHLRGRGHRRILTEGGPRLMGSMLDASAVEQLFLTISPKVLGRGGGEERPPFSDDVDLLDRTPDASLLSVRRSGDHLFLRYRLRSADG
jgi:riboflavin biosynthesis pyrimidine reductase